MPRLAIIFAAALSTATSTASLAAERDTRRQIVKSDDLDLRTTAGEAALRRRVLHATETVCGDAEPGDLLQAPIVRRCRIEARRDAMPRVDRLVASVREAGATLVQARPTPVRP